MSDVLQAPHDVAFTYRRSVGGAERLFLSGLSRREIWGSRGADGSVTVPPVDWDPESGAPENGFVRVADSGVVVSWTWVPTPGAGHPLDRPFAFALVEPDGAGTAVLHVVDVSDQARMHVGMRVRADWRAERTGSIRDIRAFVPEGEAGAVGTQGGPPGTGAGTPDSIGEVAGAPAGDVEVVSDMHIRYSFEPGWVLSGFLTALSQRRIEGGRCPACSAVYVPPRPRCPACRVGPLEPTELPDRGAVTSYTVVHLPVAGMTIDLPFVCAWIRLDGADVPFAHLLEQVASEAVHIGQRVTAVWADDEDLAPSWESIRYFRPEAAEHNQAPSG